MKNQDWHFAAEKSPEIGSLNLLALSVGATLGRFTAEGYQRTSDGHNITASTLLWRPILRGHITHQKPASSFNDPGFVLNGSRVYLKEPSSALRPDISAIHKEAAKRLEDDLVIIPIAPQAFRLRYFAPVWFGLEPIDRWHTCNAHLSDYALMCPNCSSDIPLSNSFPSRLATGTMVCGSCGHTLTETAPNGLLIEFNVLLKHKND